MDLGLLLYVILIIVYKINRLGRGVAYFKCIMSALHCHCNMPHCHVSYQYHLMTYTSLD